MRPTVKSRVVKIGLPALVALAVIAWYAWSHDAFKFSARDEAAAVDAAPEDRVAAGIVKFAESKWKVAGIQLAPVARTTLPQTQRVTGTLALNEDR